MRIGIFDSGLGGLITLHGAQKALAPYDVVYLGDTARLPYGDRTEEEIFEFTKQAVEYLISKQNCKIVFLFCNTASAQTLRKLQQKGYRVLGIIIPTVEKIKGKRIGILATQRTVDSGTYIAEVKKLLPDAKVFQQAAPLLVPMIESGKIDEKIIKKYIDKITKYNIDTLILGCTHYPIIKSQIQKLLPKNVRLICQNEIIGPKITEYLYRHPEIEAKLSKNGTREFLVTKLFNFSDAHHKWLENIGNFDRSLFRLVVLHDSHESTTNR